MTYIRHFKGQEQFSAKTVEKAYSRLLQQFLDEIWLLNVRPFFKGCRLEVAYCMLRLREVNAEQYDFISEVNCFIDCNRRKHSQIDCF